MFCSHCGAETVTGSAFCGACGRALHAPVTTVTIKRPTAISVLAVLQFIGAAIWLLIGTVGFAATAVDSSSADRDVTMLAFIAFAALGMYQLICGIGLWKLRSYGRTMQLIAAGIGLLGIPLGTIISIVILVYLTKPGIKILFSGRDASTLTPDEIAQVSSVTLSGAGTAIVIAACLLLGVAVVGIIAAIAVPGLLRARTAGNEASAIGTLRAISSAEATYAVANRGYYDSVACLAEPSTCLPTHSGAAFLVENYVQRGGYAFEYRPGLAPRSVPFGSSRSSVETFVVLATPVSSSTGTRQFCLDHTGDIRFTSDPAGVDVGQRCPANWMKIE